MEMHSFVKESKSILEITCIRAATVSTETYENKRGKDTDRDRKKDKKLEIERRQTLLSN